MRESDNMLLRVRERRTEGVGRVRSESAVRVRVMERARESVLL